MNIFLKVGEILFKIIGSVIILLAIILENLSNITKITIRESNHDTNKINLNHAPLKKTPNF